MKKAGSDIFRLASENQRLASTESDDDGAGAAGRGHEDAVGPQPRGAAQ